MKAEPEEGRPLRGILDTSVLIRLGEIDEESLLPEMPLITAVTLAELSVGPLVAKNEEDRHFASTTFSLPNPPSSPSPSTHRPRGDSERWRPLFGARVERGRRAPSTP